MIIILTLTSKIMSVSLSLNHKLVCFSSLPNQCSSRFCLSDIVLPSSVLWYEKTVLSTIIIVMFRVCRELTMTTTMTGHECKKR